MRGSIAVIGDLGYSFSWSRLQNAGHRQSAVSADGVTLAGPGAADERGSGASSRSPPSSHAMRSMGALAASSTPRIHVRDGNAASRKSIVIRLGTAVGLIAVSPFDADGGLGRG